MEPLLSGDIVKANNMVESPENRNEINYFPLSNVIKATTRDSQGNPISLRAGRLGYIHTCYTADDSGDPNERKEMCLVDFTQWGKRPEEDDIISAILPRSFLELETRFQIGDTVAAKEIVEYRLDKLEYDTLSTTPYETELALLKKGSEAFVIYPDAFLDLDFSFQLKESHLPKYFNSTLRLGKSLILLVTLPPTFVELVEKVEDHQENG